MFLSEKQGGISDKDRNQRESSRPSTSGRPQAEGCIVCPLLKFLGGKRGGRDREALLFDVG